MTQFITYPTFLDIDKDKFSEYHQKYVNKISFIVAPVMLIELLTLFIIAYLSSDFLIVKTLILLLVIWMTTFFIMIPSHNRISKSFNKKEIINLINYNWVRTILWSFKLLVIIFLYYEKF
tara:strand:- start:197 stop:556 length:360 start_codon:yes stop_codon:yes gene_type:complete